MIRLPSAAAALGLILALLVGRAVGQAPHVRVETDGHPEYSQVILNSAWDLHRSGRLLLDVGRTAALLAEPQPEHFELPPPRTSALSPAEIAALARKALVRIGWYYRCDSCEDWHLSVSGAYALTDSGVIATCYHTVDPAGGDEMKEGFLVVIGQDDRVLPVASVLAADPALDIALLRVDGGNFTALSIEENAAPGDPVYLLSDPLGNTGYFSSGIINRFYWEYPENPPPAAPRGGRPWPDGRRDMHTLEGIRRLQMNVSTDWAPGSSGCAVLDSRGNAVGHVSTINPQRESEPGEEDDRFNGAVLITLHNATPARAVRLLVEECLEEAARPAP
jgi:hypothetical protein